jgi:hypothetical protein
MTHPIPQATDTAVVHWMKARGWDVAPGRHHELEPGSWFYVWHERSPQGNPHALWVADSMVHQLGPQDLVAVLDRERIAEDLRISFRVRIEERGTEYRVSLVPRRSGEFRVEE